MAGTGTSTPVSDTGDHPLSSSKRIIRDPKAQLDFKLRPAEHKDAEAIAVMGAYTWTTTFGYSISKADLDAFINDSYTTEAILRELNDQAVTLIVAEAPSGTVAGFVQLRRDSTEPCVQHKPKPVELQRIYIHPDFHGYGLARTLVSEIEKIAREEKYETLWLGVWEENFKGHRVYEKLGFVHCGLHDFKMGECVQRDWIMFKGL